MPPPTVHPVRVLLSEKNGSLEFGFPQVFEMWATANQGGMLPEQVFPDGSGTGAATPLARAHAEFILFINAIKQAAVPDMPAVVAKRYLQ